MNTPAATPAPTSTPRTERRKELEGIIHRLQDTSEECLAALAELDIMRLEDRAAQLERELSAANERIATLCQANAALEKDRERLDWLEGRIAILACEPKGSEHEGTWAIGPSGNFQIWAQRCNTARAAIDAARSGEGRG